QRWQRFHILLEKDISSDMPHATLDLIRGMFPRRDRKYLIQFFQREFYIRKVSMVEKTSHLVAFIFRKEPTFRLRQEQNDEDPEDDAPTRVPPESALGGKGRPQGWEGEGDDEVEAPCHCQKGKGEDQEWATSEFIDGEESRKGENPIENACAHGGEERRTEGVAAVDEDLGGIMSAQIIGFKHIALRRRSIRSAYNFKRTYHNPKSGPDLPLHHQRPTNRSRRAFCSVHRDRCRFSSDTQAQDKTSGKEIRPGLHNTFPNGSHGCYEARNEDGATTTEISIKWFSQPAAENGTGKIRSSDYQACKVVGFGCAQLVCI
ncbi:MAG: hypothetical protein Q9203_004868, partial [Teloschistes exilis]